MSLSAATRAAQASEFALRYRDVVEALMKQGVPETVARNEARLAATMVFVTGDQLQIGEPCPTCGRTV